MIGKWPGLILLILAVVIGGRLSFNREETKPDFKLQVENGVKGVFLGQEVMPPQIDLAMVEPVTQVLGDADATGEKHIYVDLATQTLTAYQGDSLFMKVLVSTGKWGRTPTGDFTIWSKFRATRMSGGSGNDYYNLPNVPYVMFFSGSGVAAARGFALHGTYWHNNFGHPMSHGCVNMRTVDAQKIFGWADIDTKIIIDSQIQAIAEPSPSPEQTLAGISSDGKINLEMKQEKGASAITWTLTAKQGEEAASTIWWQTLAAETTISIPLNTVSPDNKYMFLKQTGPDKTRYLVLTTSGKPLKSGAQTVEFAELFEAKYPEYKITEATGWGGMNLIVFNTDKAKGGIGPSFWFDLAGKSFIQLSNRFE